MAAALFDETADETKAAVNTGRTRLVSVHVNNLDAAVMYLQLFDAAAASVTVGTTTPDLVIPMAASGTHHVVWGDDGPVFWTACTYAVTTTPSGSTGPTAEAVLSICYE